MRPRIKSALLPIVSLAAVTFATADAEQDEHKDFKMKREFTSGYAPVNGLKIYYEIHGVAGGKNPPLVLLHGGGDTIETSFGRVLPGLARSRQVIAFEQQGYGHTADIAERPFSFEQSADDTARSLNTCTLTAPIFSVLATAARSHSRWRSGIRALCASSWWRPHFSAATVVIRHSGSR